MKRWIIQRKTEKRFGYYYPRPGRKQQQQQQQTKKKESKLINPAVKTEDITIIPKAVNKTGFKLVDVLRVT